MTLNYQRMLHNDEVADRLVTSGTFALGVSPQITTDYDGYPWNR